MPSVEKTEYGLHLWNEDEKAKRADLTADNKIIDERLVPSGAIIPFAGSEAPKGWLVCNGQEVGRIAYAKLFSVIGTIYGSGNDSTTFNLPDMRDRFPLGSNANFNVGETGGSREVILTEDTSWQHGHDVGFGYMSRPSWLGLNHGTEGFRITTYQGGAGKKEFVAAYTGGGLPHDNMSPFLSLNYIIKF